MAHVILKGFHTNLEDYTNDVFSNLLKTKDPCYFYDDKEPTDELKEAVEETSDIASGKIKRKGYHNVRKMFEDILNED